jgi:hypothetical protein
MILSLRFLHAGVVVQPVKVRVTQMSEFRGWNPPPEWLPPQGFISVGDSWFEVKAIDPELVENC